ncbi:MAG: excinuclease ABC subunit UvrC [Candidatus Odinarchaeia archaeon]
MGDKFLQNTINQLPDKNGVYLFKDKNKKYIYIGKAKSLKKRVLQHFYSKNPKEQQMVSEINSIDFILTPSEIDSLILEQKKIKELKPKYNVNFKDDKSYPYIKITVNEEYPRVLIERKIKNKHENSEYIGPFTNKRDLKKTVNYIRTVFPVANCNKTIKNQSRKKPCLEYGIKRCPAPCYKKVDKIQYNKTVNYFKMFFEGKELFLINKLEKEMKDAANKLEYEKAALIRDRINAIKRIIKRRIITTDTKINIDFITLKKLLNNALIGVLSVNSEGITNQQFYELKVNELNTDKEIYESFCVNYYNNEKRIPDKIIIDFYDDKSFALLKKFMKIKKKNIKINKPVSKIEKELTELLRESAESQLRRLIIKKYIYGQKIKKIIEELKRIFPEDTFSKRELRIEGFDISNIMGREAVGSKVVFINGFPDKKQYRRYRIKTITKQDDYSMLRELIFRRFKKSNMTTETKPDLILVDGGKGQLNAGVEILNELGLKIPVIALSKKFEEIHIQTTNKPLRLPIDNPLRVLLQYVRDEAHRFAIDYHKKLRVKKMTTSILDKIPGVGVRTKKKIQQSYKNLEDLINEPEAELKEKLDISINLAKKIKQFLKENL